MAIAWHKCHEISIHALREEGDFSFLCCGSGLRISIHALREEGDSCAKAHGADGKNFYPRPP